MNSNFDVEGAKKAGYSEQEIKDYLSKQPYYQKPEKGDSWYSPITKNFSNFINNFSNPAMKNPEEEMKEVKPSINEKLLSKSPGFDVEGAKKAGYSDDEINDYLEENQPKRSKAAQAGRIGLQYALGAASGTAPGMAYDIGVAPLASKEAANARYREELSSDLELLMDKKSMGQWDEKDQEMYEHISKQLKDTSESGKYAKTADISIRGLAEKATGLDLQPEGVLEHAANWAGFIKDPKKIMGLGKIGLKPLELTKAIFPTGTEALRGLGAGVALENAREGEYGPIGTMAAVIAGDLLGGGTAKVVQTGKNLITQPKKTIAEGIAKFTPKEKIQLQKDIIKDFRESGLQADAGTLTDSNLIKWTQSRLAQSGLTGKALDEFKDQLTSQIKGEYKTLADSLGEAKYASTYEAGQALKEGIVKIRDADLAATRKLYENATKSLKEKSYVDSHRITSAIERLESQLKPGRLKSSEQQIVLDTLEKIKTDVYDSAGNPMYANIKDLMNNKIALNDIINYEVQGGSKQLLKEVVKEIDRTIISHGKDNPSFAKNYINANKRFSEHAKTFRNKPALQMIKAEDPAQLINKMNSVHGIRSLDKILSKTPEGKEIFRNLKRSQLEKVIGDKLVDSTTQQAKLGTFSKLLEKGKNREVIREMLGAETFKRLERLQKNAGKIADASEKFYNASKSGVVAADAAVIAKGLGDIAHLLYGNPWPLLKTGGILLATRQLSGLLANPEFLKILEDVILATEKGGQNELIQSAELLKPYLLQYNQSSIES